MDDTLAEVICVFIVVAGSIAPVLLALHLGRSSIPRGPEFKVNGVVNNDNTGDTGASTNQK